MWSLCVWSFWATTIWQALHSFPPPPFSLSITVIIYPTFQLSKIKKTLSVGLQKTRICVKVWTCMCTHVRVCCHFIEKESIFLLCDFSFHPLLCEPECVYWNYFPRTENYIAHNCRLSSSRFILQTQKDFCCTVSK